MRLAALLAELPSDQLERLAAEHLGADENVSRSALCTTLEGVLRSYSFVRKFVADRLPPSFAILEILLDADGCRHPAANFREVVAERTRGFADRIATGDLVARDDSLRLYRRVLLEARRNDVAFDAGEAALLGVLRRELNIRPIEHFLVEHHSDFREFWARDDGFLSEMHALRSCGLVFGHEGQILLAEEVVPLVRQTLGFEMPAQCRRRLYGHLSGGDLSDTLARCELKSSGSRDEKLERLLASYVQPTEVLRGLPLQMLRDICRDTGTSVSGSKEDLIERLVHHFLHAGDVRASAETPLPPPIQAEPRMLDELRFRALFAAFKGDELGDILAGIDSSRITGAKETKVTLIVESPFCEVTLLEKLTNRSLEETLARRRLRTAGSKRERIERLVDHFRTVPEVLLGPTFAVSSAVAATDGSVAEGESVSAPGSTSSSD